MHVRHIHISNPLVLLTGALQCCNAFVSAHKFTKSNQWRRNSAITAITHQPPGALHMLMPLQPVTLTFMTSLSAQPDIMLACHRCDLWSQWLSLLMKPLRCLKLLKPTSLAWPSLSLMWVHIHHLTSGINQSKAPMTAGSPAPPSQRPPYTHTHTTHWLWLWSQLSSWPEANTSPVTDMLIRSTGSQ